MKVNVKISPRRYFNVTEYRKPDTIPALPDSLVSIWGTPTILVLSCKAKALRELVPEEQLHTWGSSKIHTIPAYIAKEFELAVIFGGWYPSGWCDCWVLNGEGEKEWPT